MSEALGPLSLSDNGDEVFLGRELVQHKHYSEETAQLIDAEVKRIISESYKKAQKLLEENGDILKNIADALLERETLSGDELTRIMNGEELAPQEEEQNAKQKASSGSRKGKEKQEEGQKSSSAGETDSSAENEFEQSEEDDFRLEEDKDKEE
jgi:cell division protease FtsH